MQLGKVIEDMKRSIPKMSSINKVLRVSSVWAVVVSEFKLGDGIIFPDFPSNMLYGALSESIHNPDLTKVIVSNRSESDYKLFFNRAAKFCDRSFLEFNEENSESETEEL